MEKTEVSVICNTYNHGPYIREALEGFVMQKTNFKFEVLVHDDASTDNTADIIREFEKKYSDIIKPIYQTENQYSKGISITTAYVIPRVKGRYIAFCEGDDYWTDPLKLQKQYDEMEKNLGVDMCAHGAIRVRANNGKTEGVISRGNEKCIFNVAEIIAGGGGFVATNSLFYRKELAENEPDFRKFCPYDYALQIQGALRGGILYLPDNMSAYREGVPGSWTKRMATVEYSDIQTNRLITMLDMVDQETHGKYTTIINKAQLNLKFYGFEVSGRFQNLRSGELKALYKEKNWQWKLKTYLKELYFNTLRLFRK